MKAILYAGAVLMTAAGIYGFVDYKKSSRSLSTLYESKEVVPSPSDEAVEIQKKEVVEKFVEPTKELETVTQKTYPSKSAKEVKDEIKFKEPDKTVVVPELVKKDWSLENETIHENNNGKKISADKKRKVNYKMYSRGALDERFIEKEKSKLETGKKIIKKEE